ncbi:DUF1330 domain-containing protein [Mycolicibacterium fluoranthenivorans]|uniref:DUF1330 domain-containing protein n=1 Tax=Mycolicibacterium fluoranthenivorans TaxID=258505 RepID=A0A7G8PB36_9MYCO|nr:DUF1330 domain-containing protein [Mycolicibacterium fluoranthenivorans]QNJ91552.1 DUF1330 domain-containing protein [Mycolicibacterium fluoranthenivorans]
MSSADRHIDPTESQVRTLVTAAQHNDTPIVMVNLLAFNDEGGRDSYLRYAEAVQPHLDRVGASIVYVGDATHTVIGGEDAPWWDTILLVQYPSRAKFLDMVLDPGYQKIATYRSAALHTSGLIATEQWMNTN